MQVSTVNRSCLPSTFRLDTVGQHHLNAVKHLVSQLCPRTSTYTMSPLRTAVRLSTRVAGQTGMPGQHCVVSFPPYRQRGPVKMPNALPRVSASDP